MRPADLLLDGLATLVTEGPAAARPTLRPTIDLFLDGNVSDDDFIQWGRGATSAAFGLWDADSWAILSGRHVARARESGALASLVLSLNLHVVVNSCCGNFELAESLVAEQKAARQATGIRMSPYGARMLAAYLGRDIGSGDGGARA